MALSRPARIALTAAAVVCAALVLAAGAAVMAFRAGPVSAKFLTPYLERAAAGALPGFSVSIDDTILVWAGLERGVDLRASGVRIRSEGGETAAELPEIAVVLSAAALAQGRAAPRRVDFFGPEIFIRRSEDGRVALSFTAPEGADAAPAAASAPAADGGGLTDILSRLDAGLFSRAALAHLEGVTVTGGALSVFDARTGRVWTAPAFNAAVSRTRTGLAFESAVTLDAGGGRAVIGARGAWVRGNGGAEVNVDFKGLTPSAVAEFDPALARLAALEADLEGSVSAALNAAGGVVSAEAEIAAAAGTARFAPPGGDETAVAFQSAALKARYAPGEDTLSVESFDVDFGEGGELALPGADFALPAAKASFKGVWRPEAGSLDVEAFHLAMDGPELKASGRVTGAGAADTAISVKAGISRLPAAELRRYWPPGFAPDARIWADESLKAGKIENLTAEIDLKRGQDGFAPVRIDGGMKLSGFTVMYAEGMAPVTDADGTARLDIDRISIEVKSGESAGLTLTGGEIELTGLDGDSEQAHIRLGIAGPARSAVALIDGPALRFASAVGLSADRVEGESFTDLSMKFPLLRNLLWDDVRVTARSFINGLGVKNAALGLDLTDAAADLTAGNAGMDVSAEGRLGDFPVRFSWRENFEAPRAFKSRYAAETRTDSLARLAEIGVDAGVFGEGAVTGGGAADLVFIERENGEARLSVNADLSAAEIDLPAFDWRKPAGAPARGDVTLDIKDGRIAFIPSFALTADGLTVRGTAPFDSEGSAAGVQFSAFRIGRTDAAGGARRRADGGWDVNLNGSALDLAPAWSGITGAGGGAPGADGAKGDALPADISVSMRVRRVWLDDEHGLEDFSGVFTREGGVWRAMFAEGGGRGGARFTLRLAPGAESRRILTMKARNAGAVLSALGIYENMRGGELEIQGAFDDTKPDPPLAGSLTVNDYRIVGLPWLAELASVMALTGIVESIGGEGLAFSELSMPFERTGDAMIIKEGRASGLSLGITVSGTVYRGAEALNLHGVIVPAFLVNNILTEIPLLGTLLSGGEEGGGVFAANYTVTGSARDPEVSVNPLSALAPGFLRNMFGVFDGGAPAPEPAPAPP